MSELDRASLDRTLPPRSGSADWDEVLRGAGAGRERRGRRLVAVVAALLVLVVGTASAFGTARDLFGNGKRGGVAFHAMEGKRGSFFLRDVSITDAAGNSITDAAGNRSRGWRIEVVPGPAPGGLASTGQYAQVTGRGRYVGLRPIRSPRLWHARLEGFVTRPGEATQRVVITEKGGVQGVFVLTPLQPGILKRDSGTVTITRR
jgi:hypothetical protein